MEDDDILEILMKLFLVTLFVLALCMIAIGYYS